MPFMAVGSRIEGAERPRPFVHRQLVRMQHAWLMICGDTLKSHELREHVDPPRPLGAASSARSSDRVPVQSQYIPASGLCHCESSWERAPERQFEVIPFFL